MKTFQTYSDLAACAGQDVAVSEWITVTQQQVNQFADATGDHQWIHVDVERARSGPYQGTIAHGYLTLSLLPQFFQSAFRVEQKGMSLNYGLNKVRFMSPVLVGSRLRARLHLAESVPLDGGGFQMTWDVTVEREGVDKPVCVAQSLARHYAA